ncbi:hypothetical protein J7337_000123 [Fusarium musae]|uniref:Uncharacterized protein n=1 Tax=Fusarium musae TaxID=1042133 RepID=A0A9P8DQZ0_9HYPO|nr:hypothetical protein J7337_000123 [Fusarium musae]KAG9506590.1 hypothetical protein J7337_000123 [Fusarium musae]
MAGITINGDTINPAAVPGVSQTGERTNFILIQGRDVDLSLEQKLEPKMASMWKSSQMYIESFGL